MSDAELLAGTLEDCLKGLFRIGRGDILASAALLRSQAQEIERLRQENEHLIDALHQLKSEVTAAVLNHAVEVKRLQNAIDELVRLAIHSTN